MFTDSPRCPSLHPVLGAGVPAAFVVAILLAGCMPYAAGTTARTVPPDRIQTGVSTYFIPGRLFLDSVRTDGYNSPALGTRVRVPLGSRSSTGVHTFGGGATLMYKRRVTGAPEDGPATALMGEVGVINNVNHAYLGLGTVGPPGATITPYGGARAMQVVPLTPEAATDLPVLGVFGGLRIGAGDASVSPEVGLYYDEPAFNVGGASPLHVVPSITVNLSRLL
jgi:hypothetical protein